jgi:hypothetical protein
MSASLLNAATMPGSQPGASVGIAAQAAQAAQANGPMAGFEALLAAFFGDQGLTVPTLAGPALPGQALAVTPGAAATPTGKTNGKAPAAGKADATDADKAADATATGATDAANAALALVVPVLPIAQPVATAQAAAAPDGGEAAPDAGLSGKPAGSAALAQFAAASAAPDAKTAKDAGVIAQDTTKPAVAVAVTAPSVAKPDAPAAAQGPAQPLPAPALSDQTPATTAAALPAPTPLATAAAAAPTKPADAPGVAKDKVQTAKVVRIDGARTDAPPVSIAGKAPVALMASADGAGKDASSQEHDPAGPAAAEAKPAASDNAPPAGDFNLATNTTASANAVALAHAATLVRGSPQTVANLAAQIAKKLDGRSSRFDVQLDPAGLGKVDVHVEIDAAGKMTAAMNFDSQQAANELKSRAGELQRALEQAGFDLSGGMSFDVAGQGGRGQPQGQDADNGSASRGRAFEAVLNGTAEADADHISFSRAARAGVDIRI